MASSSRFSRRPWDKGPTARWPAQKIRTALNFFPQQRAETACLATRLKQPGGVEAVQRCHALQRGCFGCGRTGRRGRPGASPRYYFLGARAPAPACRGSWPLSVLGGIAAGRPKANGGPDGRRGNGKRYTCPPFLWKCTKATAQARFDVAFPDREVSPPQAMQLASVALISANVSRNLL
jgi:hypothetical protein